MAGILKGDKAKFDTDAISKKEYSETRSIVSDGEYEVC